MLEGFYKVRFQVDDAVGRSVMYAHAGRMLGGNSAFAHYGTYQEIDGVVISEITSHRHNEDPNYKSLLGADIATIDVRGSADGDIYRFRGGSPQMPGAVFQSVMTPIDDEIVAPVEAVGEGGIVNGLYSIHIRMLDGIEGGLTGVMLLHDGRILGGDAFFYYLGTYTSANGRWKGQILNQEHTPGKRRESDLRRPSGRDRLFRHLRRPGRAAGCDGAGGQAQPSIDGGAEADAAGVAAGAYS